MSRSQQIHSTTDPFATLETSRGLEPKCDDPAIVSGIVTDDAPVSCQPIGHLHDDVILLLRPESFRVLLSWAN